MTMKRKDMVSLLERRLGEMGFQRGAWIWQPRTSELILILGQTLKTFKLKPNITKTDLTFQLGRIAGLVEAIGIPKAPTVQTFKAAGSWTVPNGFDHGLVELPAQ